MFVNSDGENCPITGYQVVASESGSQLSSEQAQIVALSGNLLTVKFDEPSDFVMYVKATSVSGSSAAKKFYVKATAILTTTADGSATTTSTAGLTDFEKYLAEME